jgi:hypothetical protein
LLLLRKITRWLGSLPVGVRLIGLAVAGAILARGRYDWEADPALASRCWVLSLYFFWLLLAGIGAAGQVFGLFGRRLFWATLAVVSAGLNLPYHWLGLAEDFYLGSHPLNYARANTFMPEWLGPGHRFAPWNSTDTLLLVPWAVALVGGTGALMSLRSSPPRPHRKSRGLICLLLALIVTETWLHLSYRSPYTYILTFGRPASEHFMSAYPLLPNNRGVVNPDVDDFIRLEELFQGNRADTPTMLVRRAFPFYLSSHFSYFLGPYNGFLIVNLLLWILGALALGAFCRDLTGSPSCGWIATALTACGPGFIMYAAQPMSYLPGYAALALSTYLFHRLLTAGPTFNAWAIGAAGILVGLTMLTSDTITWGLFYLGYAWWLRRPWWRPLMAVAAGAAVYAGFLFLLFHVYRLVPDHTNDKELTSDFRHLATLVTHFRATQFFTLLGAALANYGRQVLQANFFVPVGLALLAFLARPPGKVLVPALLLLLASFAGSAFLYLGESPQLWLAAEPRFSYSSFPAIVLLAAFAVDSWRRHWSIRGRVWLARMGVALPLLACAVFSNIDAFGFMPYLYYHFYYNAGGYFS